MKAFNQEKILVGAFSVIVKSLRTFVQALVRCNALCSVTVLLYCPLQYALYVPGLTLLLKLPLLLPPLSTHLARIRGGYVRARASTTKPAAASASAPDLPARAAATAQLTGYRRRDNLSCVPEAYGGGGVESV